MYTSETLLGNCTAMQHFTVVCCYLPFIILSLL